MNKFMLKNCFYAIAVVLASALPTAANSSSSSHASAGHAPAHPSSHDGGVRHGASSEVHWGYANEGKPERWGDIKPEYELCKTGKIQSPINIAGATPSTSIGPIEFHYNDVPLDIVNNGHTIQINYPKGSYFILDGERFELLQFHFHSPSENLLEDRAFHMEAHLVHKNAKGELGVVGVFLTKGKPNTLMETLWSHMPEAAGGHESPEGVAVNASGLLPADRSYYKFKGSLTTPPCTEGVFWNVFKTPVSVSAKQIQKFNSVIGFNARPAQPVGNNRTIVEITVAPPPAAASELGLGIQPVNFDELERESAEHGAAASHENAHEEVGHAAAAKGHGAEEGGHGGGHHAASAPLSYFVVWALTLALASMIGSYALMSRKWRFKVVFNNMRNMYKLKNMVGGASEAGQFKYRDEYFYAKVKPEGYVHLPHGVNHGHHGDDHDHGQDHGAEDRHSPEPHAHGPAADNHGESPEAGVDYDSKDSTIFAGGFVFLTLGVFLISYSPELFKHFDAATHAFVDGYHEPTGFGVLSFIFRFGLGTAMTIYGILGMAKNTRSS